VVQAWYQGGISLMDFTDPAQPTEIAYFDRGPIDSNMLVLGGDWSAYWYNGDIYASEIARGLDVFELTPANSDAKENRRGEIRSRGHLMSRTSRKSRAFESGGGQGICGSVVVGRKPYRKTNRVAAESDPRRGSPHEQGKVSKAAKNGAVSRKKRREAKTAADAIANARPGRSPETPSA